MSADPPSSQTNRERFRHWITDVKITSGNRDPSFRFSARMFIDDELVCNLSARDNTRPLEWLGLLYYDIIQASTVALRLCKSVNGRPRFFNFPPFIISEADEESGEATLELAEAAWVVTIKSLTPAIANQLFPDELENFDAIEGVYNNSESEATMKYLFKYALQFASIVAKALPESTAKVSFLIYMKAWELLDQQSELDGTVETILRGLTRIRDIVDIVSQASDSMLTVAMSQSKGAIDNILALFEDVSVCIFNRYTTNELARIPPEGAEDNYPCETGSYLARLEELQLAFYSSWSPTGVSPDADGANNELLDASSLHDTRILRNEPTKTDWYEPFGEGLIALLAPTQVLVKDDAKQGVRSDWGDGLGVNDEWGALEVLGSG
ncbi:hypothetical protein RSOLAG22IIIB_07657 [Rhizoctonia solani]|uniref:Uncharacterized protein n=1 Tax=Rhizoctonia solani TaxID=456999 RepID=A0A0K6FP69_9AGAM|nr:hypothetical protein RSOLAG22IIIB_07657 [Rhizoctonia solani]